MFTPRHVFCIIIIIIDAFDTLQRTIATAAAMTRKSEKNQSRAAEVPAAAVVVVVVVAAAVDRILPVMCCNVRHVVNLHKIKSTLRVFRAWRRANTRLICVHPPLGHGRDVWPWVEHPIVIEPWI
jgi:hypothetical protein